MCVKVGHKVIHNVFSHDSTGSSFPAVIDTSSSTSGSFTVIVSGTTISGESIALGEATFTVPGILYLISI